MGRYYGGDIAGKFWFGIQSSGDAQHFGVDPEEPELQFWNCGDYCNPSVVEGEACKTCKPEDECEARESNQITFHFTEDDIPTVKAILNAIERNLLVENPGWAEVATMMAEEEEWKKGEDEEWISHDVYDRIFEMERDNNEFLKQAARYMLGTQILRCLTVKRSCSFWCEL